MYYNPFSRKCFFTMESTSFKSKFMSRINNSFGSRGMSLALNEAQFSQFIQFLKHDGLSSLPIRKAATTIGEQKNSRVWVLGEKTQINQDGEVIPERDTAYMWLDETIQESLASVSWRRYSQWSNVLLRSEGCIGRFCGASLYNCWPSLLSFAFMGGSGLLVQYNVGSIH